MQDIALRPATRTDWPAMAALLEANALPLDGARDHLDSFIVAHQGDRLLGIAGLEVYGEAALLRSVAVSKTCRGQGIGRLLVIEAIRLARSRSVSMLYLLTTTADLYFGKQGFSELDRRSAPEALQASQEFQGACPASATFMARNVAAATAKDEA